MGLREDALAAAEAAKTARVDTARAVLAGVLTPCDVADLEVVADTAELVVFCGDEVCLGVRQSTPPRVSLVRDLAGWTHIGDVTSLAQLGILLASQEA